MPEFYLRLNDPLAPVYEVDFAANTWRMAASRIGVLEGVGGTMRDDGAQFRGEGFVRVRPISEADGVTRYSRDEPVIAAGETPHA